MAPYKRAVMLAMYAVGSFVGNSALVGASSPPTPSDNHHHHDNDHHNNDGHENEHYLQVCNHRSNILFLFDLSGSVGKGDKAWNKIKRQMFYARDVMEEAGTTGQHPKVRFGLSAYSREVAEIRSLNHKDSHDYEYMRRKLDTFDKFKSPNWDSPKNGYRMLTRPGNRYTHVDKAIKVCVNKALDLYEEYHQEDGDAYHSTTVILFSDARPEHFDYRNFQKGKLRYTNDQEFEESLKLAKIQRHKLIEKQIEKYGRQKVWFHCVMLKTPKKYTERFTNAMCDSYEELDVESKKNVHHKIKFACDDDHNDDSDFHQVHHG